MVVPNASENFRNMESFDYTTPSVLEKKIREDLALLLAEETIDLNELRKRLGYVLEKTADRYNFSWSGKQQAIRGLQEKSHATLVPDYSASINFDMSRNVFIEGDNLEVLKLLYKSYCSSIKMIYIDPPYNTGNDFIYPDNFTDSLHSYLYLTGQKDNQGNLLTTHPETSGRYHSAWLNMMYPRLFIARQLLSEDGVIFISIDDNEIHNLRMIMNEIFGEENFVAQVTWEKRSGPPNDRVIGSVHEYILIYAKSNTSAYLQLLPREEESKGCYTNPDNDSRGSWAPGDLSANAKGGRFVSSLYFEIENPLTGQKHLPPEGACWRFNKEKINKFITEGRIFFGLDEHGRPKVKRYLSEVRDGLTVPTIWKDLTTNRHARTEIRELFGESNVFETPKPLALLKRMIEIGADEDDIILDFFAGSCSTAQAVLELNHQQGTRRKFIMIQLPESTQNKTFPTIADVGMERIRRAIAKLQREEDGKLPLSSQSEDRGFRVFRLQPSHYKTWSADEINTPDSYVHKLELFKDALKEGWEPLNVLWEVALKEGFELSAIIEHLPNIEKNTIWRITDRSKDQAFYLCLDKELFSSTVEALSLNKNNVFICLDSALDDTMAANLTLQCRLKTL